MKIKTKRSFLYTIWNQCDSFRLFCYGVIFSVFNLLITEIESITLFKSEIPFSHIFLSNILGETCFFVFFSIILPKLLKHFSYFFALKNYCKLPLTKEEMREKKFRDSIEYFEYINNELSYQYKKYTFAIKPDYIFFYQCLSNCDELFPDTLNCLFSNSQQFKCFSQYLPSNISVTEIKTEQDITGKTIFHIIGYDYDKTKKIIDYTFDKFSIK